VCSSKAVYEVCLTNERDKVKSQCSPNPNALPIACFQITPSGPAVFYNDIQEEKTDYSRKEKCHPSATESCTILLKRQRRTRQQKCYRRKPTNSYPP
jgi:hypothetical protein